MGKMSQLLTVSHINAFAWAFAKIVQENQDLMKHQGLVGNGGKGFVGGIQKFHYVNRIIWTVVNLI